MARATPTPTLPATGPNAESIACWRDVLAPKWVRFRHLLSSLGQVHSDLGYSKLDIRRGYRVLDVACGFGETTLELADRVGPSGRVLGLDCTQRFVEIAERERRAAGMSNVAYRLADIDTAELAPCSFEVAVSRFGLMYCASPVRALRAIRRALEPGGQLGLIVWRSLEHNECWQIAEEIALRYLPPPGEPAQMCSPGPFSMADPETDRRILEAAGYVDIELTQFDAPLCVGRTLAEAVEYQTSVGPGGYVMRELGERALAALRAALQQVLRGYVREDGSVWLGSSTWFVSGRSPRG